MDAARLSATLLIVTGLGVIALGSAARAGRVNLNLGGHTRDTVSADSWRRSHDRIGSGFRIAGLGAIAAGATAAALVDWAGWILLAGIVWLLVFVVAAVIAGLRLLETPGLPGL